MRPREAQPGAVWLTRASSAAQSARAELARTAACSRAVRCSELSPRGCRKCFDISTGFPPQRLFSHISTGVKVESAGQDESIGQCVNHPPPLRPVKNFRNRSLLYSSSTSIQTPSRYSQSPMVTMASCSWGTGFQACCSVQEVPSPLAI